MRFIGGMCTVYCGLCRLSEESEQTGQYVSEVSRLKQEVTSRDRAVIELNNELECLRQQITQLNDSYQLALHQRQLAQQAAYVCLSVTPSHVEFLHGRPSPRQ